MTLILKDVKSPKKDYGRTPDGQCLGRIAQVVDFGIQPQTDWQTKEPTDSKPRLMITWEIPEHRIDIEQEGGETKSLPRWQGREYTISSFEQAGLMKLVQSLKPDLENFAELLNIPCLLDIGSTSGGNAKVKTVMRAPDAVPVPELENDPTFFDFDNPDRELFLSLPAWQQKKIKEAENYSGFADNWDKEEEASTPVDLDDDIPF